jgi:hypothetical protein
MADTETNDDKLIKMVSEAGHLFGPDILVESKRAGLPFALALALVEQESGFQNIFGCDIGPRDTPPYCHQPVTRDRVKALIAHVQGGGISNGVGLTQLTSIDLILQAEAEGGAQNVGPQCLVGFRHLHGLIERHGEEIGIGAYNGGEGNPQLGFAKSVLALRDKWQARINHTLLAEGIPEKLPVEPGGKFNAAVEAHLLHIWHEVHINPEVSQAVKDEVAAWKSYFRQLRLWSSKHEIDTHHQDELTFAHSRLHVI